MCVWGQECWKSGENMKHLTNYSYNELVKKQGYQQMVQEWISSGAVEQRISKFTSSPSLVTREPRSYHIWWFSLGIHQGECSKKAISNHRGNHRVAPIAFCILTPSIFWKMPFCIWHCTIPCSENDYVLAHPLHKWPFISWGNIYPEIYSILIF